MTGDRSSRRAVRPPRDGGDDAGAQSARSTHELRDELAGVGGIERCQTDGAGDEHRPEVAVVFRSGHVVTLGGLAPPPPMRSTSRNSSLTDFRDLFARHAVSFQR